MLNIVERERGEGWPDVWVRDSSPAPEERVSQKQSHYQRCGMTQMVTEWLSLLFSISGYLYNLSEMFYFLLSLCIKSILLQIHLSEQIHFSKWKIR